jgi:hypothetical protein
MLLMDDSPTRPIVVAVLVTAFGAPGHDGTVSEATE